MKITTVLKLVAISLVFIFLTGPAAAGVFDQLDGLIQEKYYSRESTRLSGYMRSAQYSLLEPQFTKPDLDVFTDTSVKPRSDLAKIDLIEKDLWQSLPTSGPNCPTLDSTMQRNLLVRFSQRSTNRHYPSFILEEQVRVVPLGAGVVAVKNFPNNEIFFITPSLLHDIPET